jgi:hypothetical protein
LELFSLEGKVAQLPGGLFDCVEKFFSPLPLNATILILIHYSENIDASIVALAREECVAIDERGRRVSARRRVPRKKKKRTQGGCEV